MHKGIKRLLAAAFLALGITDLASAQTATLLPNGRQQFFDADGNPLASGQVFMYVPPNTTTSKTTWQDSARATPNTNPVALDSAGTALIYGTGAYRQLVKDALGNTIWDAQTAATGAGSGSQYAGISTGTPNAQIIAPTAFTSTNGEQLAFTAGFTNSGPMTLNAGTGAWPVYKNSTIGQVPLVGSEIVAGNYVVVAWNSIGSRFVLVTAVAAVGSVTNDNNLATNALILGGATGTTAVKVVAGIVSDGTSGLLLGTAGATVGSVTFANATSGTIALQPVAGALGTSVLTLPAATDRLVGRATTDTLSNKTLDFLTVTSTAADTLGLFTSTDATANSGPSLDMYRNSASPAASDVLGRIFRYGKDSAASKQEYASDIVTITDPTSGSEDATWEDLVTVGGAATSILRRAALASGVADPNAIGLPKGQLSFPAVANPSTDANTLDAYAEGTWTPSFVCTGCTFNYSARAGNYLKIGKLVYANAVVILSNSGNTLAANPLSISGLPFTSFATSYTNCSSVNWFASTSSYYQMNAVIAGSSTDITLYGLTAAGTTSIVAVNGNAALHATNSSQIQVACTYQAAN